jgi:hypothetical protein
MMQFYDVTSKQLGRVVAALTPADRRNIESVRA